MEEFRKKTQELESAVSSTVKETLSNAKKAQLPKPKPMTQPPKKR